MASGKSAGSIFVDMLLNDSQYQEGLKRSSNSTKRWSNQQKASFNSTAVGINAVGSALGGLAALAASALSVQKIIAYSDSFKGLEARLSLVTQGADDLAQTTQKLFDIAQGNSQPLEDTIDAYTRLNNSLNASQKASTDLIKFTDLLSKTLLISGTNAAGAATFFQQFGQAASSDFKAIGQELQTFADQNPRFYGILRDEAAKYGKKLKDMAKDGELSFDFIAKAVNSNSAAIESDAAKIGLTLGKAFTELDNSLLIYIGRSPFIAEATNVVAEAMSGLADIISDLSADSDILGTAFYNLFINLVKFVGEYNKLAASVAEKTNFFGLRDEDIKEYEANAKKATDIVGRLKKELADSKDPILPPIVKGTKTGTGEDDPVIVNEDAVKEAIKLQRELQSIYDRNEGLITGLDAATLRYNDSLEDLNELLKNGKINQEEYNSAVVRAGEELDKSTEKANVWAFDVEAASKRAAENIQDNLANFLFDPFAEGLDGMLLGFVNTLRKMAAEAAAAQILGGLFGEDGGGLLGGLGKIFGMGGTGKAGAPAATGSGFSFDLPFFADGGYLGPGQFGIAGEAGAELLYGGKQGVSVIPQDKLGGGQNNYYFDARGADRKALAETQAMLLQLAGPGKIEQRVMNAQKRGAL